MTVLPHAPFDVPAWVLELVASSGWPAGDEVATWDVADRWFGLAAALASARADAFDGSARILAGYDAAGIAADGFRDAWERLAGEASAPLNALVAPASPSASPPASPLALPEPYGGLRAPLAVHQEALEEAVPRAARLADPRLGGWFRLINAGGPADDPTRGLNCLDGVLALFDTYLYGRPRVAAPRTFDGYAHGVPDRPTGGELLGLERIEKAAGATFQNLCPFLGAADPAEARDAVDAAMLNLANHLHNSGHGSFAFIVTDLEGGGCHAWSAINQDGTILFLDPVTGRIGEETPLYAHGGKRSPDNVVSMDALVVDGQGASAPLPYHGPGQWSRLAAGESPT